MKRFTNAKDALDYLRNEANTGEEIILDERASISHPKRIYYFKRTSRRMRKR